MYYWTRFAKEIFSWFKPKNNQTACLFSYRLVKACLWSKMVKFSFPVVCTKFENPSTYNNLKNLPGDTVEETWAPPQNLKLIKILVGAWRHWQVPCPPKNIVFKCRLESWTCRPSAARPMSETPGDLVLKDFSKFWFHHGRAPTSSLLGSGDPGFAMPSWATQCRAFHN